MIKVSYTHHRVDAIHSRRGVRLNEDFVTSQTFHQIEAPSNSQHFGQTRVSTKTLFQTNNNNDLLIMVLNYTPKRDSYPNNQSITHQHYANAFRIRLLHMILTLIPDIMVRCSLFSKLHDTLQSSLRYDIQFHYFLVIQTIVSS